MENSVAIIYFNTNNFGGKKLCQQILYAWKKRMATNNSIVVKQFSGIATTKLVEVTNYCHNGKFRGDTLFQQKLFWWRQIVVATA
jgi:hypothetical protein